MNPIADNVVALRDGRIVSQGSLSTALQRDNDLSADARQDTDKLSRIENDDLPPPLDIKPLAGGGNAGKLVVKEEIAEGRVRWSACTFHALIFCLLLVLTHTSFSESVLLQHEHGTSGRGGLLALLPLGCLREQTSRCTGQLGPRTMGQAI